MEPGSIECQYAGHKIAYASAEGKIAAEQKAAEFDNYWMQETKAILKREPTRKELLQRHIDWQDDRSMLERIQDENWRPTLRDDERSKWQQLQDKHFGQGNKLLDEAMKSTDRKEALGKMCEYFHTEEKAAADHEVEDLRESRQYQQLRLWLAEISWEPDAGLREVTAIRQAMLQMETDRCCPMEAKSLYEKAKWIRQERIDAFESKRQANIKRIQKELDIAKGRRAPDLDETPDEEEQPKFTI